MGAVRDYVTIADLVALPHLGLTLAAGGAGAEKSVLWTHTSELEDPGPWLEGGELLIVNGFGIPPDPAMQVAYLQRLAHHRLAGLAVSVRAPDLTAELLEEADRLAFPVLRIPREVPFIEISYLVANSSDRAARGRLARHLRVFETLRHRNSVESRIAEIYAELERVSGYRLALLSRAGRPLLADWDWAPDDVDARILEGSVELQVLADGYILPLVVGDRVTAYLVGKEQEGVDPGGLAALQHVGALAALDAVEDQRRREARHREGSALFASAIEGGTDADDFWERMSVLGAARSAGVRLLACDKTEAVHEIVVRDWLADRGIPHLLLDQEPMLAIVACQSDDVRTMAADLGIRVGASPLFTEVADLTLMRSQALWSLQLTGESADSSIVFADEQAGVSRWLTPDLDARRSLAERVLRPLLDHDAEQGSELLRTLAIYFQNEGGLRRSGAALFIHEHTVRYRLKQIEALTGRRLQSFADAFELWLAIEARHPHPGV
jgi:purine catabolism regulator